MEAQAHTPGQRFEEWKKAVTQWARWCLLTPDTAEPSSMKAKQVPFIELRVLPRPGLVKVWARKPNVESN